MGQVLEAEIRSTLTFLVSRRSSSSYALCLYRFWTVIEAAATCAHALSVSMNGSETYRNNVEKTSCTPLLSTSGNSHFKPFSISAIGDAWCGSHLSREDIRRTAVVFEGMISQIPEWNTRHTSDAWRFLCTAISQDVSTWRTRDSFPLPLLLLQASTRFWYLKQRK